MRIEEIAPYINYERVAAGALRDVVKSLRRWSQPKRNPAFLAAMYGDELGDLEIEEAKLKLAKTKSQIEKIRASAAVDLAKARRGS